MDFFNKLGNMASETYKKTSKKTGELAKEAKIRMKMNEEKGKIDDLYIEIGKVVFQKYTKKEKLSQKDDLNSYCEQIEELSDSIEQKLQEILKLKGKKVCDNCDKEIDVKDKFCPACGAEQPEVVEEEIIDQEQEDEVKEVEIIEEDKE